MVVSLQEPMKEEVIPVEEVPEDATGAETSAEGEVVEGEKPAEGEAKPEEASKE